MASTECARIRSFLLRLRRAARSDGVRAAIDGRISDLEVLDGRRARYRARLGELADERRRLEFQLVACEDSYGAGYRKGYDEGLSEGYGRCMRALGMKGERP